MIRKAASCGMCFGARNAYNSVIKLLKEKKSGSVVLYKKLLHNKGVIEDLKKRGAVFTEKFPEINSKEDIVVVRAHGEKRSFFLRLNDRKIKYADCTCKKVRNIHALIEEKSAEGYKIIIIGDKNHAEVRGSADRAKSGAIIISETEDIRKIRVHGTRNDKKTKKYFIIAQTTFDDALFKKYVALIIKTAGKRNCVIHNSLCDAQRNIHEASVRLAKKCRTMIVLGGSESANTRHLFEKCRSVCEKTFLLENKSALFEALLGKAIDFSADIGITGGASTPPELIDECKDLLEWSAFYKSSYKEIKNELIKSEPMFNEKNETIARISSYHKSVALSPDAKYVRGTLILLGASVAKIKSGIYAVPLAGAYELLETAILVHDDVFDNARTRRGVIAVHEAPVARYGTGCIPQKTAREAGKAAAICSGDMFFFLVNKKIIDAYSRNKNMPRVLSRLQEVIVTTIKGELLDVLLPLEERSGFIRPKALPDLALDIDAMKTAMYTTVGPLSLGMILAGASDEAVNKIEKIAVRLGIAFQLKDDLLDIFAADSGKGAGQDCAEYKITLLYALVSEDRTAKEKLSRYYGKKPTRATLNAVRRIMEQSGARAAVEKRIENELAYCRTEIKKTDFLREKEKSVLLGFISFLEMRKR